MMKNGLEWFRRIVSVTGFNKANMASECWVSFDEYNEAKEELKKVELPEDVFFIARNVFNASDEDIIAYDRDVLLYIEYKNVDMDNCDDLMVECETKINDALFS